MSRRVDALLIHGVSIKLDGKTYFNEFAEGIRKHLPIDFDLNWHPVVWNDLIYNKELQIYNWMGDMGWKRLRYFGCTVLTDILAYAPPEGIPKPGDFYYDVNKLLESKFDEVAEKNPDSKKVLIAHSLGCQIAFSFCWRRKIDLMVGMGNPMTYFAPRFKDFGKFPEKTLKRMVSFYNVNDPVSTIVSRNPNLSQCEDVKAKSWNPKFLLPLRAHSMFWRHGPVHKKISELLAE